MGALPALLALLLAAQAASYDSVSQMSPSSREGVPHGALPLTSSQAPSQSPSRDPSREPSQVPSQVPSQARSSRSVEERPVLDRLAPSKNVEEALETNDVEVLHKHRYYDQIRPTRTQYSNDDLPAMSLSTQPGEAMGAPRGRGPPPEPRTAPPRGTAVLRAPHKPNLQARPHQSPNTPFKTLVLRNFPIKNERGRIKLQNGPNGGSFDQKLREISRRQDDTFNFKVLPNNGRLFLDDKDISSNYNRRNEREISELSSRQGRQNNSFDSKTQALKNIAKVSTNRDFIGFKGDVNNGVSLQNNAQSLVSTGKEQEGMIPRGRQGGPPEIQDIITGLVKLLNGNVNVQANTQPNDGRPIRPQNTRINNRGPPRISDVPLLPPDFDTPGPAGPQMMPPLPPQPSTKLPPPYPFDRPPPVRPFLNGVPLPEQIVPLLNEHNYRPGNNGFINNNQQNRPQQNLAHWQQRPRPRPQNQQISNRRPNPNLPMYKPQTNVYITDDNITTGVQNIHKEASNKVAEAIQTQEDNKTEDAVEESTVFEEENVETITQKVLEALSTPVDDIGESFVRDREPLTSTLSSTSTSTEIVTTPIVEESIEDMKIEPTKQEVLKDVESVDKKKTIMVEKDKPNNGKKQDKDEFDGVKNTIKLGEEDAVSGVQNVSTVLEGSIVETSAGPSVDPTEKLPEISSTSTTIQTTLPPISVTTTSMQSSVLPTSPYRGRPGIVLDDPEFRPAGSGGAAGRPRPRPRPGSNQRPQRPHGEVFDVTVSAVQGPGSGGPPPTVHIENVNPLTGQPGDIIVSASGEQGFVSIDGKRTYLNLLEAATQTVQPSRPRPVQQTAAVTGTGYAVPEVEAAPVRPGPPIRRPTPPPVRIDTCIVGDDSTCDQSQNEKCKTETGISSCQCRPGYARRNHRDPCRRVVAMVFSLRVDRIYDRKISWDEKLGDRESEAFQQLSYEAVRAVDSAFSMTPYSDEFVSGSVNTIYRGGDPRGPHGVFVNVTVLLEESGETLGGNAGGDISRHLLGVIQRRSNNVGASALWVDRPSGSVSPLQDLDECSSPELNDCHELATCTNVWGSFKCECPSEARDAWAEQPGRAGRHCLSCPSSHCSGRGTCLYRQGRPVCSCTGAYYGSQCEVDGEVVGVAVGASLAALLVILLTLAGLIMWSRRWNREQKSAQGLGSPVFGYMAGAVKAPNMGQPPYQVSLEERMRWAQLADVMAQANHYAQPEPGMGHMHPAARNGTAMYGAYPTLPMHPGGTLPPVPMPRMHLGGSSLHLNAQSGNTGGNTLASRANTIAGMGNAFAGLTGKSFLAGLGGASTSSESDSHAPDRADLLGTRGFHVPRPKSRSNTVNSMANQSGIYYDVDYENAPDPIYGSKGIPLSTYTMNRGPPFYRQ